MLITSGAKSGCQWYLWPSELAVPSSQKRNFEGVLRRLTLYHNPNIFTYLLPNVCFPHLLRRWSGHSPGIACLGKSSLECHNPEIDGDRCPKHTMENNSEYDAAEEINVHFSMRYLFRIIFHGICFYDPIPQALITLESIERAPRRYI